MAHITGHVELIENGHGTELRMIGEFDLANADGLRQCLAEIAFQGKRSATIDMARVDFIDSATLGALIAGHLSGLAITVRAPSAQARRVLDIAGVGTVLDVED